MFLHVGIAHTRDEIETLPTFGAEMSVAGIIGTAEDADEVIWPLDTPIYVTTNEATKIAALGLTGTLRDAVAGISAQLTSGQVAAKVVIVRVEEGADADETIGNIIGDEATRTGMWAFLDAPNDLGVTPRLICAPGYTQQFTRNGVLSVPVTNPGSAYSAATVAFSGGGSDPGKVLPTATVTIGAGPDAGKIMGIVITDPGANLTAAPTVTLNGTGGSGAALGTPVLGNLANGVVAAIPTVLNRLRASFQPEGPSTSREAWLDYVETIQSDRIMHPTRQDVIVLDEDGDPVTRGASSRVIGLYIRRDYETDGVPARSVANQPINGIVGVTPPVEFSITDGANEGQEIVGAKGGIIVRGETGVESAIASGGFVFWGTDTLSEDPLWQFSHVVRLRDYIELGQVRTLRYYLGRFNISVATVNAVLETIRSQLARLEARGYILGFRVGFEPDKNTPEELRQGNIQVLFKAEEAPVLRKITVSSRRFRQAFDDLVNAVATSLNSLDNAA
ncbi:phage tail sheath C-terminal domain-containing protein [Bosea massiliensis]|uniref:Phage tail sheath C-terminal domain-containing protein n=1 Tax=Bosea massiliensis TaxID=151419 RepID=A0ABW0P9U1_9HYPH